MKKLINKDGTINIHEVFQIPNSEKRLKIVGTKTLDNPHSFKKSVWDTIDTVKNLESGKLTEIKRQDLANKKPYIQ